MSEDHFDIDPVPQLSRAPITVDSQNDFDPNFVPRLSSVPISKPVVPIRSYTHEWVDTSDFANCLSSSSSSSSAGHGDDCDHASQTSFGNDCDRRYVEEVNDGWQ